MDTCIMHQQYISRRPQPMMQQIPPSELGTTTLHFCQLMLNKKRVFLHQPFLPMVHPHRWEAAAVMTVDY